MEFTVSTVISVSAKKIYEAWLDSNLHTQMTGGEAGITANIGESFTAWDGYISGKNVKLIPNETIVQLWRTVEFEEEDEDSTIEITLAESNGSTTLTLFHSNLSEAGKKYINGWEESYFTPMKSYFENN